MWALMLTGTAQASPTTVTPGRYGLHLKTATHSHTSVFGEAAWGVGGLAAGRGPSGDAGGT